MSGRFNIASGDDFVPVQAGSIGGGRTEPEQPDTEDRGPVGNVRQDNAQVGIQANEVTGPIEIRMGRR